MKHSNLKLGIFPFDIKWGDIDYNLDYLSKAIKEIDNLPDVLILPEMFSTGFVCKDLNFSSLELNKALDWMKNFSAEHEIAICGSVLWHEENYTNRLFWISPDGLFHYDKRHLFSYGGEDREICAGSASKIPTVSYKDWKIALSICYDLRFPVWMRNTQSYDLMINVANWPEARADHWQTLLKARAIENQSYVVGVNRTGRDGNNIPYKGNSLVYSANGDLLLNTKEVSGYFEILLSRKELEEFRNKYPFLNDLDHH